MDILTEQEYHFFAVTEIWLTSNIPTEVVKVPEYNFYRRDREGRGGGIGIYIKSMYQVRLVDFGIDTSTVVESIWLEVTLHKEKCIGVIYRPPSKSFGDFANVWDCPAFVHLSV
ncbi:unnamed protein product [Acanthoscelides obtectus]|uniref:Uncharacterized protein n=1 Tax=Acanthoscelides obtectus TaxID=200917 RepID=A0A9P0L346_ACAOB|nr:unnamed protein product [Acanthoscelides obtectus]CAK1680981.1 hypothetical protein AOBTE_LOCUS32965 [Acanthoscelides obtectus]